MGLRAVSFWVLASVALPAAAAAQEPVPLPSDAAPLDMREVHDRCVRSMVRLERPDGHFASGFVTEVAGRRVIVTNAHVAENADPIRVVLYDGTTMIAHARFISDRIDLAVLVTEDPLEAPALEVSDAALVRGERVVLGGNPGGLSFITTEGVVAGVVSGTLLSDDACGEGNNCIVLDTEAEPGSSGGPVVDQQGHVIGMLWGVYMGTSLSVTIHGTTLATELATAAETLSRRRRPVARAH
jgi:S1-C subfamily serine protease